jgi:hypothetical protein
MKKSCKTGPRNRRKNPLESACFNQNSALYGMAVENVPTQHDRFDSYTTEKWRQTFAVFAAVLVKKAYDQKLDSVSLGKALDLILNDTKEEIVYLPIGAYQTTLNGKLVWIVAVKWEYASMSQVLNTVNLLHIRGFVFDQKSLKQVGFVTCG